MTYAEIFVRVMLGQKHVLFGACCPGHGILQLHVNAFQIAFDAVTDEHTVAMVTADRESGEIMIEFAEIVELPDGIML